MTDHVSWRRRLGEAVAAAYAVDPTVGASMLGGSVARGWADRFSDVEVFVFWLEAPSVPRRIAAVERSGGSIDVDWAGQGAGSMWRAALGATGGRVGEIWPYEDEEWSEHFYVDGVNVGVSGFHVDTVERWVADLVDAHRPTDDAQFVAAAIVAGVDVTGGGPLDGWRRRLAVFPPGLVEALLRAELEIDEDWWSIDMLAERDDRPAFDALLGVMARRIIRCLLALNRSYLPDPRPKWAERLLAGLARAPEDVAGRLSDVWRLPAREAAAAVQALFDETLDLVEADVDVAGARRWFRHRRAVWEAPPGGWGGGTP